MSLPELQEALRFCELVTLNRHPGCEIVASMRLHPIGWLVGVDVAIKRRRVFYDAAGPDALEAARNLAELINAGSRPCGTCQLLTCMCSRVDPRDTIDERP